ncbi:hypothetical protein AVEN_262327-1 [Araneus ventricosus]|uniref:Uncharacterized protein n=1 Tax=Araneus ventricosus TaxID=182803 RepID=A0A4Y2K6X8_ARAVE|nr:hypothetical protein AVEN_262327-1 [Araneus ventricosus]
MLKDCVHGLQLKLKLRLEDKQGNLEKARSRARWIASINLFLVKPCLNPLGHWELSTAHVVSTRPTFTTDLPLDLDFKPSLPVAKQRPCHQATTDPKVPLVTQNRFDFYMFSEWSYFELNSLLSGKKNNPDHLYQYKMYNES